MLKGGAARRRLLPPRPYMRPCGRSGPNASALGSGPRGSTGSACDLIECWDAQERWRSLAPLLRLDLFNLFLCGSEADAELLHITEPSLAFSFSDPVVEVVSDLFQSRLFGGADDEDWTPDTGFSELLRLKP
ncbi:hypothetical protein [Embleya sp. NPDC005575]|uniref:hypothetical protein n=1 Tax=Embleya sp. NPDC005575 TaxID=3156892 RepID=UPI00339F220F